MSGTIIQSVKARQVYTNRGMPGVEAVVTTENGRRMAKGKCPVCGTNLNRILAKA